MARRISWSRYFSFNSIRSKTKRRASGIVLCRRSRHRRRDTMPIECKVRGIPRTDIGSTRRKSCSIPMRKNCFSRLTFRAKRPGSRVGTTGARCSEYCLVRKRNSIGAHSRRRDIRTMRLSMSCTSKGSPRGDNSGVRKEKRGTFLGLIEKIPYLKGTRSHRGRVIAGASVRSAGGQLLGLHDAELSSRRTKATQCATRSQSFGRWSGRFTRRASRFGWTLFTTTPPKATKPGRCIRTAGSIIRSYYLLGSGGRYHDYSGCGNTTRCAHPSVRALVLRSLQHWT